MISIKLENWDVTLLKYEHDMEETAVKWKICFSDCCCIGVLWSFDTFQIILGSVS